MYIYMHEKSGDVGMNNEYSWAVYGTMIFIKWLYYCLCNEAFHICKLILHVL